MEVIAQIAQHGLALDLKKPQQIQHSATTTWDKSESRLKVDSNRFQNKMRRQSSNQVRRGQTSLRFVR
jgi:hypothetical protein